MVSGDQLASERPSGQRTSRTLARALRHPSTLIAAASSPSMHSVGFGGGERMSVAGDQLVGRAVPVDGHLA